MVPEKQVTRGTLNSAASKAQACSWVELALWWPFWSWAPEITFLVCKLVPHWSYLRVYWRQNLIKTPKGTDHVCCVDAFSVTYSRPPLHPHNLARQNLEAYDDEWTFPESLVWHQEHWKPWALMWSKLCALCTITDCPINWHKLILSSWSTYIKSLTGNCHRWLWSVTAHSLGWYTSYKHLVTLYIPLGL